MAWTRRSDRTGSACCSLIAVLHRHRGAQPALPPRRGFVIVQAESRGSAQSFCFVTMLIGPVLVIVHALAATVWTGGPLVLDLGVLPQAWREQSAQRIRDFEALLEPLGLTALAIQMVSGLWMGWAEFTPLRERKGLPTIALV